MPTIRSNDAWIRWEQHGKGPPVLLVHGFGDTAESIWHRSGWIRALVDAGRRAIALDLRGHGESDHFHAAQAYDRDVMAADLAEVIRHANVRRLDFVAFSMGGELVLRHLLQGGLSHVRRAAFISVGRVMLQPRRKRTALSVQALRTNDVSQLHHGLQKFRRVHQERGSDLAALAALLEAEGEREPLAPEALRTLAVPTLFVCGDGDWTVGDAQGLVDLIPAAELARISDADHDQTVHDPRTRALVLEFLQDG